MGLALTIVYIVLTIISPTQFGPAWANYHALVYLAIITALFSLPSVLSRSSLLRLSRPISSSPSSSWWASLRSPIIGWAEPSTPGFLSSQRGCIFLHCRQRYHPRRLKIVIFACVASCLGLVAEAFLGWYRGFLGDTFVLKSSSSPAQGLEQLPRLRAVGFLNDPNDFSQMLIIIIALLFFAWRPGRSISNFAFVLAPAAVLLWAIYLTHSRGALLGLAMLVLMAGYKRFGKVPSLVLAAMLGLAMMALDFTGGRAIDASAGVDRL